MKTLFRSLAFSPIDREKITQEIKCIEMKMFLPPLFVLGVYYICSRIWKIFQYNFSYFLLHLPRYFLLIYVWHIPLCSEWFPWKLSRRRNENKRFIKQSKKTATTRSVLSRISRKNLRRLKQSKIHHYWTVNWQRMFLCSIAMNNWNHLEISLLSPPSQIIFLNWLRKIERNLILKRTGLRQKKQ